MFFVYILQLSDNTLYTGYTKNLEVRLEQHGTGKGSKYVRSRLPLELVYYETLETRSEAMRREIEIKKLNRSLKFQLIDKMDWKDVSGSNGILGTTTFMKE